MNPSKKKKVETFYMERDLPTEIVQEILFHLPGDDLRQVLSCNMTWKDAVVSSNYFWKMMCKRDDYPEIDESKKSDFYNHFLERRNYWERVYWYNHTMQRNWETNNYKEITFEIREPSFFLTWLFFDDLFACVGRERTKLYVYSLKSKKLPTIFAIRKSDIDVKTVHISRSGKYFIHFLDKISLTVWDYEKGTQVADKLWNHVAAYHVYKNLIVLETHNKEIEVFNIETGQIEYEFRETVKRVFITDGRLVFTTMDNVIHILKLDDKSLVKISCCNKTKYYILLLKNDLLLSFCKTEDFSDITLCLWNINTKTKLHSTLLGNAYDLQCASFVNKYLYIKRTDTGFIELWDYIKGTLFVSFKDANSICHKVSNNYCMVISEKPILSLWSLRTRDFICNLNLNRKAMSYGSDLRITDRKLAYVKRRINFTVFYIRDYEIFDS